MRDSDHSPYGAVMTTLHPQTDLLRSPTCLRVSPHVRVYVCVGVDALYLSHLPPHSLQV